MSNNSEKSSYYKHEQNKSMTLRHEKDNWLFVGASGKVGSLITRYWRIVPPKHLRILRQTRVASFDAEELLWSPLEGTKPLLDWINLHGPVKGMFMFAGVTPGVGVDLTVNITIAEACLNAAMAAGIKHILIASSSAVYGAGAGVPLTEEAQLDPVNDYGCSKMKMEAACSPFRDAGLSVCCLRIGNVAGADALLRNASPATLNSPVRLDQFSNGHGPLRSYVGPATLARILESFALSVKELPTTINVSAPQPVTMESLLVAIGAPWQPVAAPPRAIQNITLDCTQLSSFYVFEDSVSLPQTIVNEYLMLKGIS